MSEPVAYFPHGCVCHICDKKVEYKDRKRCIECGRWFHNWCGHGAWTSEAGVRNNGPFEGRSKCYECFEPFSTMEHCRATLLKLDTWEETESIYVSGVILVASLNFGPDEEKIAEFTGVPLDDVRKRGKNARANHIWTDDGKIVMDIGDGTDPRHSNMGMLIAIMCLEGLIERRDP